MPQAFTEELLGVCTTHTGITQLFRSEANGEIKFTFPAQPSLIYLSRKKTYWGKKDNALGRGLAPRREPPAVTPDAVTPDAAPRTPAAGLASCRKPRKQQAAGRPCPEPGLGAATGAWGKPPTSGFQAPAKLQVP